MAYLRKLKSGKWRAEVERRGVRKTAVWDSRAQAKMWADSVETDILDGRINLTDNKTWEDAVERYLNEVSPKKRGYRWEQLRLAKIMTEFSGLLADIQQSDIAKWRDERLSKVSEATYLRERNLVRNIFSVARNEWQWMTHDPFVGVKSPAKPAPRYQRWRWQEIKRVCRFLGYKTAQTPQTKQQEVALAFMIALRTGLRAGEILQVGPNSLNGRVLTLTDTKTEKRAQVPLTKAGARLCRLATEWTVEAASRDALFRKARDATLCGHLRFHDARATALTLLSRKVDVMTLARISRHKNISLLQNVYYRESAEEIAARI